MKRFLLLSFIILPFAIVAADAPADAIDQKAKALEAQLSKALDSSPQAAKTMLELVNLYHANGRVFGLVRVGERFAKAQSTHANTARQCSSYWRA